MSLADLASYILPGSDPNAPNTFVRTPEDVARLRALAQQLGQQGSSTAPIRSPWQGAAQLVQALTGAVGDYQANRAQRLGQANAAAELGNALGTDPGSQSIAATPGQTTPALQESDARNDAISDSVNPRAAAIAAALGGGSEPAPSSGNPALAAALGAPQGGGMAPYQAAIAKIESGGNYGAMGPQTSTGDRAYGKYQVMGANIPQWTQAALGRAMTPQEFLANPQAQDAVFNHQFGGYVQQYGPQNAASMWLTGRTLANGGAGATDQLGTNGQAYADQFTRNLGAAPASAAISAATGAHVPTWAEVQADNAQGAANIAARTSPAAAGAALPGGPQGAGASPSLAPSQADLGQLAAAMRAAQAPQGGGVVSPANAAAPYPNSALAAAAGLHAPMPNAPQFAAPQPQPNAAPSSAPQQMASAAPSPAPGMATPQYAPQSPQGGAFHPDVQSLLNVLSDPWATPAQQEVAKTLLQTQMPTRPSIIDGPTDPNTGYPTKLVFSPTQGVLGRLNPDGSVSPVGSGAAGVGGGTAPAIPPGVDSKKYRETLAESAAKENAPTAAAKLDFAQKLMERPSYKELASALPSYNSMTELIKDNTAGSTKAFVDAFGRVINPGASVRQGTFQMLQEAQSLPDKIKAEILKAYDGDQELSADALAAMTNAAKAKVKEYQRAWEIDANQGSRIAKSNKLDPSEVIPILPQMVEPDFSLINSRKTRAGAPAASSPQAATVSPAPASSAFPAPAVATLKANPSPQMRAHFDEIFGPGASAKVLGQ